MNDGLGPVQAVSLSAARQQAFEPRAALYAGNNPVEARETRRLKRVLALANTATQLPRIHQDVGRRMDQHHLGSGSRYAG
jgi:hypothetical protein